MNILRKKAAVEWNVPTIGSLCSLKGLIPSGFTPSFLAMRSRISFDALFVKVTQKIERGSIWQLWIICTTLSVTVCVFHEPAPALMRRGQLMVSTASCCWGLSIHRSIEKSHGKSREILAFPLLSHILAGISKTLVFENLHLLLVWIVGVQYTFLSFFLLDLVKLFGSRSRVKLLEKLVIEDVVSRNSTGFFIRELCRDVDEQINAVRRELMNLETLGILKSYEQNKKKFYHMNRNSLIYNELKEMFLKSYDVMAPMKEFFKWRKTLDLVTISNGILDFRNETTNNIVDIFIIGELDKIEFNNFLEKTFFGKKVKYAIMSLEDFTNRLEYNDKLVLSILSQKGNVFLRDRLEIEANLETKLRAMKMFSN